jgi:hypothetical protein
MTPRAIAVLITSVIMGGLFLSSFHHTEPYPLPPAVSMPPASSASANICAAKGIVALSVRVTRSDPLARPEAT